MHTHHRSRTCIDLNWGKFFPMQCAVESISSWWLDLSCLFAFPGVGGFGGLTFAIIIYVGLAEHYQIHYIVQKKVLNSKEMIYKYLKEVKRKQGGLKWMKLKILIWWSNVD